jgi:hypothetical protein
VIAMRVSDVFVAVAFVAAALLISTQIKAQQRFDPTQSGQAANLARVAASDAKHIFTLESQKSAGIPHPD